MSIPISDSEWREAEIDCAAVFPKGVLPPVGSSIDMGFVDNVRRNPDAVSSGGMEEFLPTGSIYLRQACIDTFNELTKANRTFQQVLIGSPGVGKSVLLFIVALYQAAVKKVRVIYVRKTTVPEEDTSAFLIEPESSNADTKKVSVRFAREIDVEHSVKDVEAYIVDSYTQSSHNEHKRLKVQQKALLFVDGVNEGDPDLGFKKYNYLCTSGGHDGPKSEQQHSLSIVILNAWEKETLKLAVMGSLKLLPPSPQHVARTQAQMDAPVQVPAAGVTTTNEQVPVSQAPTTPRRQDLQSIESNESDLKFEETYFHTGGRIREAIAFLRDPENWVKRARAMLERVDLAEAKLAVTDQKSGGSKNSLDRLRTIFKAAEHFGAYQIVDSQFYSRELRKRLGPEPSLHAYIYAMDRNLKSAAGCHFEELMHECFKHNAPKTVNHVIQAEGSGAEGVRQLTEACSYWIPSTPNFANIDAAFVDKQKKLWCIQYTVSKTHAFNSTTFRTKFLRPLRQVIEYNDAEIGLIFAVPKQVDFTIPENAGEFQARTVHVDCSSIDTVLKAKFPFLDP